VWGGGTFHVISLTVRPPIISSCVSVLHVYEGDAVHPSVSYGYRYKLFYNSSTAYCNPLGNLLSDIIYVKNQDLMLEFTRVKFQFQDGLQNMNIVDFK